MFKPHFEKLGELGTAWVKECLEGGEAFSKVVLSKTNLSKGMAYIAVAIPEHKAAVANHSPLNQGALNLSAISTGVQLTLLLDRLRKLEEDRGPLILLGEDNLSYPSDPVKKLFPLKRYQFKNRYYPLQSLSDIQHSYDFDVLSESSGYPLNAFVLPEETLPEKNELTQEDLDRMASSVIAIINAAYDGETYTLFLVE